jgi:phage repressor protein C with HTH and peptisase S24 domain
MDISEVHAGGQYAVIIRDDAMQPRIRASEHVLGIKGIAPKVGEEAIVHMRSGAVLVREIADGRLGVLVLAAVNPAYAPTEIKRDDIAAIDAVEAIVCRGPAVPVVGGVSPV